MIEISLHLVIHRSAIGPERTTAKMGQKTEMAKDLKMRMTRTPLRAEDVNRKPVWPMQEPTEF